MTRHPGFDTYTGRYCKCGHREEDHSGWNRGGPTYECWSGEVVVEGMEPPCSCYRFAPMLDLSTDERSEQ